MLCYLICILALLVTTHGEEFSLKGKVIKGIVEFQAAPEAPENLSKGSCLNVDIQDTTDLTAKSKEVASATDRAIAGNYKKDRIFTYQILLGDEKFSSDKQYSIDVVLNVGWCRKGGGKIDSGEWIRENDFLTDTNFLIENLEKCSASSSNECQGPKISLTKNSKEDENVKKGNE